MPSVWVIEQGEYSDYRVVGVYSSKANADAVATKINESEVRYNHVTVAEWPLDPAADQINQGLDQYRVVMLKNGEVERADKKALAGYELQDSIKLWARESSPHWAALGMKDCLDATVWATDKQHAIKIVNEKRLQILALDQWK